VQNFPYTVHVRFNTADGQSEVAGLSRDDCSVGGLGTVRRWCIRVWICGRRSGL